MEQKRTGVKLYVLWCYTEGTARWVSDGFLAKFPYTNVCPRPHLFCPCTDTKHSKKQPTITSTLVVDVPPQLEPVERLVLPAPFFFECVCEVVHLKRVDFLA